MAPNYNSFMQAILDDPDDDSVRTIFADWLDENSGKLADLQGDFAARAEFIRVQCDLAQKEKEMLDLQQRETALYNQHGQRWLAEVLGQEEAARMQRQYRLADDNWVCHTMPFRRGFLNHISCDMDVLAQNADRWFALAPISSLELMSTDKNLVPKARKIGKIPHLRKLHDLHVFDDDEQVLSILKRSRYLRHLEWGEGEQSDIGYDDHSANVHNGYIMGFQDGSYHWRNIVREMEESPENLSERRLIAGWNLGKTPH